MLWFHSGYPWSFAFLLGSAEQGEAKVQQFIADLFNSNAGIVEEFGVKVFKHFIDPSCETLLVFKHVIDAICETLSVFKHFIDAMCKAVAPSLAALLTLALDTTN